MNTRNFNRKPLHGFILALLVLTGVMLWSFCYSTVAEVTYRYQGQNFTVGGGIYSNLDKVSDSFTVATLLGPNFSGSISPTSFSFTDGHQTFTEKIKCMEVILGVNR